MIGVFDSGVGGENVVDAIRRLAPRADITFLADREHAPYGTKSEAELIRLAEGAIKRLKELGCEKILIACCTASTVYASMSSETRDISVPIIRPTANDALRMSRNKRIAVAATNATVRSHAFREALGSACTLEIAASRLVDEIEAGAVDGEINDSIKKYLAELFAPLRNTETDTLVLGCTHFVRLRQEIEDALRRVLNKQIITVDSSESAAKELFSLHGCDFLGEGRLVRI